MVVQSAWFIVKTREVYLPSLTSNVNCLLRKDYSEHAQPFFPTLFDNNSVLFYSKCRLFRLFRLIYITMYIDMSKCVIIFMYLVAKTAYILKPWEYYKTMLWHKLIVCERGQDYVSCATCNYLSRWSIADFGHHTKVFFNFSLSFSKCQKNECIDDFCPLQHVLFLFVLPFCNLIMYPFHPFSFIFFQNLL